MIERVGDVEVAAPVRDHGGREVERRSDGRLAVALEATLLGGPDKEPDGAALVGKLHDLFVLHLDGVGEGVEFVPPTLTLPLEGGGMGGGGGTSLAHDGCDEAGGQVHLADAVVLGVGDVEPAAVDGDALRLVEAGFQRRAAVA